MNSGSISMSDKAGSEEEPISVIREIRREELLNLRDEKRGLLLRNRRVRFDDVEKSLQEISTDKVRELAVKLRKLKAGVACLKEIKKATCSEKHIDVFMSVDGVIPALVAILTGNNPEKQLEAAACIINLTCGSHKTTYKIAKGIGAYLVTYIQSASYLLQDYSSWAASNIVHDCRNCYMLLKAQGLLPALMSLFQSPIPEVIDSTVSALQGCIKYQDSMSDLMQLELPKHIVTLFSFADMPHDALVNSSFILCDVCSQIAQLEKPSELLSAIVNLVLDQLYKYTKDPLDATISIPLLRCLGYLSGESDIMCEVMCSHSRFNSCISRVMDSNLHCLKKELLWVLTNILVSRGSSKVAFDVNPVLSNLHVFLSPLDSDIKLALYFLCVVVQVRPEAKEAVQNKDLVACIETLLSCENKDIEQTAHIVNKLIQL